jgi:DNA repair and recombination RAD54-like protein
MGLGKTLQGISLLYTLLQTGHDLLGGSPLAQRVIIVCPTSLVSGWDNECVKWLKVKDSKNQFVLYICESQ